MDDPASKQAFSQARANLSYTCFQELNDLALQAFYQEDKAGIEKNVRITCWGWVYRLLPESSDAIAHFGRYNCGKNAQESSCPVMGRISEFTDVMSRSYCQRSFTANEYRRRKHGKRATQAGC
jgi:hypothetical protein